MSKAPNMTNRRLKPAKYALVSPGLLLLLLAFFVPVIYTFSLCLYQKIPGSGLAVIQNAGHFAYADNWPQFKAVMEAFL